LWLLVSGWPERAAQQIRVACCRKAIADNSPLASPRSPAPRADVTKGGLGWIADSQLAFVATSVRSAPSDIRQRDEIRGGLR